MVKSYLTLLGPSESVPKITRFACFFKDGALTRESGGLVLPMGKAAYMVGRIGTEGSGLKVIVLPSFGELPISPGLILSMDEQFELIASRCVLAKTDAADHVQGKPGIFSEAKIRGEIEPFKHMLRNTIRFTLQDRIWFKGKVERQEDMVARVHQLLSLRGKPMFTFSDGEPFNPADTKHYTFNGAVTVYHSGGLDERPALDTKVRKELRRWLRRLHDDMHISSVFVTHDQEEALEVADRVVVMNHGKIEKIGSPDEVYSSPASPFVYQFLGNVNVFHSRVQGGYAEVERHAAAEKATAFVRPHDIDIAHQAAVGALQATVAHVHPIGPVGRGELQHGGEIVEVELSRERHESLQLAVGQAVRFRPRQMRVFGGRQPTRGGAGKTGFPVLIRGKSGARRRML